MIELKLPVLTLLLTTTLYACSSSSDSPNTTTPPNNTPSNTITPPNTDATPEQAATYSLTFAATWSATTHPENFPGGPHFSGLIGAVHNEQVIFWEAGAIASDGIKQVAETGGKSQFRTEINAAIAEGYADTPLDAGGVSPSPNSVTTEFTVTRDNPLLTAITMLAPSPDWFVGVHNLNLLDQNGTFIDSTTIDLELYDAGTDSGQSYTAGNEETVPRAPIALVNGIAGQVPFTDGLPSVGTFTLLKLP